MGTIEGILGVIVVLICVYYIYRLGIGEGVHIERMRLIDIMGEINKTDMFPEQRLHVMYCVNYIVNKLREE